MTLINQILKTPRLVMSTNLQTIRCFYKQKGQLIDLCTQLECLKE